MEGRVRLRRAETSARVGEGASVSCLHHRANLQIAVAYGLGKSDAFFAEMRQGLARSRDRLTDGLASIGFPVLKSQGTYFLNVDLAPLGLNETDEDFCKRVTVEHKGGVDSGVVILRRRPGDVGGPLLFRKEGRNARYGIGAALAGV